MQSSSSKYPFKLVRTYVCMYVCIIHYSLFFILYSLFFIFYLLTHLPFTHSRIHLLMQALTHAVTYALSHSLIIHSFIYFFGELIEMPWPQSEHDGPLKSTRGM